ncbi:hypothetical protein T265_04158 [Opisthorchis viverrini]|uniref:Uncharacterized protein n=1 Tax=Opisthorchis viverrini TaxID=6198 RepID=A0A075AGX4_OPIVI|nr:hypothetical protein T265_04158 [Opisthorchis viverrini]KER29149.1 hypothetical protein T265_04158 [Opisthorchis viverrini]
MKSSATPFFHLCLSATDRQEQNLETWAKASILCMNLTAFVHKPPFERVGFWGFARNSMWFNRLLESTHSTQIRKSNLKYPVDLRRSAELKSGTL